MFLRLLAAIFAAHLSLFSGTATASAIYRLSHVATDDEPLSRPKVAFPPSEQVFRLINLTTGAPFSSFNSEFVVKDGNLKRLQSQRVDHVMSLILDQISENLICERSLTAGIAKREIMPGQAWRERTVGPIDRQALHEMNARQYIDVAQVEAYATSTSKVEPERMIYLESLSWFSAADVLRVFEGKIPWNRMSEVEGPEGLGSLELRQLAEAGDPRIKLRVRRATLRLVAAHSLHIDHEQKHEVVLSELPFATEYKDQRIELPKEDDEIIYRYELGRASQIPGLEGEAEKLSALAGLIMWHHAMTFEDIRTGNMSDIRQVDANVYLHALKKTHQIGYREHLGAKYYASGKKPQDAVLRLTLKEFLAKTLPTLGLDARALHDMAVKADSIDLMRWDFDWHRGSQLLTRHHPITIRVAGQTVKEALKSFARDVEDPVRRESVINQSLAVYEQISQYKFPETRAVDAYDHAKHSKIFAHYFVSGLDMWSATSPHYVPAFMAALATFFRGVDETLTIVAIIPQTPDGQRELLRRLVERGFTRVTTDLNSLDNYNGPFAIRIQLKQLFERSQSDPEIANEMEHAPVLRSGSWRALRDINLLPGL